jgi:hypothetical protein
MSGKHTQGPWVFNEYGIVGPNNEAVVEAYNGQIYNEWDQDPAAIEISQENKALILSAPDLLEAAMVALDDMDEWLAISESLERAGFNMDDTAERAENLRAAISKATGGAP